MSSEYINKCFLKNDSLTSNHLQHKLMRGVELENFPELFKCFPQQSK